MTTNKEARLAQWWADWWAADYSWNDALTLSAKTIFWPFSIWRDSTPDAWATLQARALGTLESFLAVALLFLAALALRRRFQMN